jgi:hypothetical protein
METELIECPECRGSGDICTGVRVVPGEDEYNEYAKCPRCKGAGKLPEYDPELLLERIKRLEAYLDKQFAQDDKQ